MGVKGEVELIAAQEAEIDRLHAAIDAGLKTISILTDLLLQYISQEEIEKTIAPVQLFKAKGEKYENY